MKYGIVTTVQDGIGIIASGNDTYKFAMSYCPQAETGARVLFNPDNIAESAHETWVRDITYLSIDPVAPILRRIDELETLLRGYIGQTVSRL